MTDSLTTLIAKVQAALLDAGTNYTTATCTAALRQALHEYNQVVPVQNATLVDVVSGQYEYELDAADFDHITTIQSVQLADPAGGDLDTELTFVQYWDDNRPWIRLTTAQASGSLIVRYNTPNTINGLDSETESTVPAVFDQVLVDGGCYWAICIRATGRVETINMNTNVPAALAQTAGAFYLAFLTGRADAARRGARPSKLDPTWNYAPAEY